jgi:hypothetical protein
MPSALELLALQREAEAQRGFAERLQGLGLFQTDNPSRQFAQGWRQSGNVELRGYDPRAEDMHPAMPYRKTPRDPWEGNGWGHEREQVQAGVPAPNWDTSEYDMGFLFPVNQTQNISAGLYDPNIPNFTSPGWIDRNEPVPLPPRRPR